MSMFMLTSRRAATMAAALLCVAVFSRSAFGLGACAACTSLTLPSATTNITAQATATLNDSNIPASSGLGHFSVPISGSSGNLPDGTYVGWCASQSLDAYASPVPYYTATSTYSYGSTMWNEVNYVLNNKQGSVNDVQQAIWFLLNGAAVTTPSAQAMVTAAQTAGMNFTPGQGQIVGVLLTWTFTSLPKQNLLVEVRTPCGDCLNLTLPGGQIQVVPQPTLNDAGTPASSGMGHFSPVVTSSAGSLPNGTYTGWCASPESTNLYASQAPYTAQSTYSAGLRSTKWNEVNYVLNNKQVVDTNNQPLAVMVDDVQQAIWSLLTGSTATTQAALALVAAAQTPAGQNFVPVTGQIIGVLLTFSTTSIQSQSIVVEVRYTCGVIGDFVWNDQDFDGLQGGNEVGINGVTVQLQDSVGNLIATTQTGPAPLSYQFLPASSSGYYQFSGLCAGATYTVAIDNTQAALTGYTATSTQQGTDTTIDSNLNPQSVVLASSGFDETIDFGYYTPVPPTSTCPSITAVQGVAITPVQMVGNSGAGGPYTFSATGLPPGLSISTGGLISGTPTASGQFSNVVITITDVKGITGTSICSIIVNPPPSATCVGITAVQYVAIAPVTLTGSGGVGGSYSFSASGLPAGLTMSTNGTISGTPTVSGTFSFTVIVTDGDGNTGTSTCSAVTVNPPPSATCVAINAMQGAAIKPVTLTGSGGMGGQYTFASTTLPAGLSISTTGVISGTPTQAGTYSYTVTITDSAGNTGTLTCSITVNPPITATCVGFNAVAGNGITPVTMTASGGTGTGYIYSATGLPSGLSMSTGGTISGTPSAPGTSTYTLTVTDSAGYTGTSTCSVSVSGSQNTLLLGLTCPASFGQLGAAYSSAVVASGGLAPYKSYAIASGALPTGLSLNTSTGVITGTPTVAGSFNFSIMVTDSAGATAVSNCTQSCASGVSTWNFASPTGNQGYTQPYTVNGITITAYGFTNWGWPTALYGNNSGSDRYGLGIDATATNGIDTSNFVQLDLTSVIAHNGQNLMMTVTNVTSGESFNVYGSTRLEDIGSLLLGNQTTDGTPFAIALGNYKYISVRASTGNVLLGAVSFDLGNCNITVTTPVDIQCGTCGASGKATVGTFYSATLAATGGSGKYTYSIVTGSGYGSLPPGLGLANSTGVISGTPITAGTYTFTTKVTDSAGNTRTVTCTMTVTAIPLDLECGTCAQGKATAGKAYSATLSATGGTAPYKYTMTGGTLPPGLAFNNGALSGTPTTAGSYSITVQVVDANGNTDSTTCPIMVLSSPINLDCGPCSAGKAYVGQGYSATMTVSGAKAPYTFSMYSGSLPPGLSLNTSTGVISGTPTKAGTYQFTAKVVDNTGNWDTDYCTIVVIGAPPVNLDCGACGSSASNSGKVGSPYTATLSVSGGKATFKFSLATGSSLPPGLTLNATTGVISGTPATAGTYTFTTMVTDANGSTDTARCSITITGSAINLSCGSCGSSGKATVGMPYSSTLTATGGTPKYTFSIYSGSLPPGLNLNATTGVISGTPTLAGTYTFMSKVADSKGNTDTQSCTIVVTGTSINLNCGTCGTNGYTSVGASYSAALTVTGGSGSYTFSIVSGSLPAGLSLNTKTGAITGTPTTAGTSTFTSRVVDSKSGKTDTQSCTIVVAPSALNLICGTCGNGRATIGTFYSATMAVTGGTAPFTYSLASGSSLPPGLSLDSSKGVISGTPTTAGTYVFTTKVVDAKGKSDTATCTIIVLGSPINLNCGPCSASKGTVGTGYSATMTVTGGTAPFTFSLASGSLPAGLTLNTSSGVISGAPTTAGTYTFTVKVADANGNVDTETCMIVVNPPPVNLNSGPCAGSKATAGSGYSATMTVTGGKGPYTFSIVRGSLPQGVSLNGSTGQVSGTPAAPGNYTFTAKVVDANGNWDTDTCTIVVH